MASKLSDTDLEELKSLFDACDTDDGGYVTATELKALLTQLTTWTLTDDMIDTMIGGIDTDGDDRLNFDEFVALITPCTPVSEEDLKAAFQALDGDNSGYLTEEEVKKALTNCGQPMSENTMREMMTTIDKDGDGRVKYEEFVRLYNQ